MRAVTVTILAALFALGLCPLGGCEEGPLEEAGETIDDAADDVGDAIDDAVDDVEDAVDS